MVSTHENPATATDLSPRDCEWLTLYLDGNEDLRAFAVALAASPDTSAPGHRGSAAADLDTSPFALAAWLSSPPIRRALAAWDHAQRRARAVQDEADRRLAIDTLKATITARLPALRSPCHRQALSGDSLPSSTPPTQLVGAEPAAPPDHTTLIEPCHRLAPSGSLSVLSSSSTQHAGAEPAAPLDHTALIEVRRAATTILRTLTAGPGPRPVAHARHERHRKPRRISDFNFSDPAEAERLLEKERRENDRLETLIRRTAALTGRADPGSIDHPVNAEPRPAVSRPEPPAPSAPAPPIFRAPNLRSSPASRLATTAGFVPMANTS